MPTKPATEAQYSFLRSLLAERDSATTGVTDIEAMFASLRTSNASTAVLSQLISAVKDLPKPAATAPAGAVIANVRANKFAGRCQACGGNVEALAGRIERNDAGKWLVQHLDGQCPEKAAPVVPVEDGLYLYEGDIFKLYTTQNDRQACKVLLMVEGQGSFDYVKGGTRLIARRVAEGTARLLTQDEARAYGRSYGFCVNCARLLNDDRSLAAGYGATCAANLGWWYPSTSEAAAILARPTEAPMFEAVAILSPDDVEGL